MSALFARTLCDGCHEPAGLADLVRVHDLAICSTCRAQLDALNTEAHALTDYVAQEAAVNDIDNEPADDWQEDGRRSADALGKVLLVGMGMIAAFAFAVGFAWVAGWVA